MKTFLNDDVLMYIETDFDSNRVTIARIVTFFRHSHKVHITDWEPVFKACERYRYMTKSNLEG